MPAWARPRFARLYEGRSVRGYGRHIHSVGYLQILTLEWIHMNHPPKRQRDEVTARGLARGLVVKLAFKSETSVGHEADAVVQIERLRIRRDRQGTRQVGSICADLVAQQVHQGNAPGQTDINVLVPARHT